MAGAAPRAADFARAGTAACLPALLRLPGMIARRTASLYLTPAAPSPVPRSLTMPLEPGKKAPAFALSNEAGDEVKLSAFKGRRVVLFFFPKAGTSG